MADPLGTFQSQLSGVMETVFKAAMYEITRLVEASFMEEITRCREQVESLKRRLKWSESRRKEVRDEGDELRWADYERLEMSNEEKPKMLQSDITLKQESGLQVHMNSHEGTDEQTSCSEMEAHSGLKASQSLSYVQTLGRLLKEETLHLATEAKDSEDLDEMECSHLAGPSKHSRFQRFPKSHCEAGLDQSLESTHNVDSGDQSEPLLQNRHVTKDLGDFKKTDYGVTSMIYNLDELQGSSSRLSTDLTYMSHYEGNVEAQVEAKDQTFQTGEPRKHKGTAEPNTGSPTRTNTDLIEFSCLLINEEGYILNQNQSLVSPAHPSSDSGGRLSFHDQGQGIRIDKSLDSPADMYKSSNVYNACDTTHLGERLQVQTTGKGSRRHICDQCSLSFTDSGALKAHKQTHRGFGQGPPYTCEHCGKAFTQACNLKVHQKIHSGQGLHLCSQCGKGFPSLKELKTHKCGQNANKSYGCTICGNKFTRLWNLKLHQRIHTQEKPHQCTTCNKCFTRVDILKVHQRTHTGERPYGCTVCGLTFKRLEHLKSHQRKHVTDL
ncbi:zinc finger protein 679 [Syngnathoides biaculeatus]|uniref:zinc finger protein 679 n=1 Tax=Syngnathoides biaculeatus TaxID=300417 RepID=UPI002ADD34EF|nr:zinc finger protein 679 [Syngnathoides biaculeatus]XP_061685140.1 zinc finger protein 679 [Syngnathoides biaculeatus]XP_061685141.1 zinc finger protein 679 [Syngnathoides biaculeatus]XP_061685142.1 zinc finger protein 679 [Syngnathoides biaculeatus]